MKTYIIKDFQTKRKVIAVPDMELPRVGDRITVDDTDGIKGRVIDVHHIYKNGNAEIIIEVEKESGEK